MSSGTFREIFITRNFQNVEKINELAKKLEKVSDKEAASELIKLTEKFTNDALADRELPLAFLSRKIGSLIKIEDYYLAAQFADGLSKKIKEIQEGKPDTGIEPPKPENESKRLEAVRNLKLLDTEPEDRFDSITRIAAELFNVPMSTITLVDENREWHKSICGLKDREGSRGTSFCGHAILEDEMLLIPDATLDPRFADNEKVTGEQHIRFYAGMPLLSIDGHKVGTFCLKDTIPRTLSKEEIGKFKALGLWAELEINASDIGKTLAQLRESIKKKLGIL